MNTTFIEVNNNFFISIDDIRSLRVCKKQDEMRNFQSYELKAFYKDGSSSTLFRSEHEEDVRNRLNSIFVNGCFRVV